MRKYDLISSLSEETAKRVTRSDESWKKYRKRQIFPRLAKNHL